MKLMNGERAFISIAVVLEIIILALLSVHSEYDTQNSNMKYPIFQDVNVMIFIGFGFLMTFLKRYGFSAIGITFLISSFALQLHPLLHSYFHYFLRLSPSYEKAKFGIEGLILSDFAAGSLLISYGALIGKVSPVQMLVLSIIGFVLYSLNETIAIVLVISDVGGSMTLHAFGAFFGLAASLVLSKPKMKSSSKNGSNYQSDLFAMIGSIFLWMFWPSFNAALTTSDQTFQRAVINTILSLTGSCIAAFISSRAFRPSKKFNMIDIQNATLAGGVAIGSTADLPMGPSPALFIGLLAGLVSTLGFIFLQPLLQNSKLSLHDTCGVLNLHGIPSVLASLYSAVLIATFSIDGYEGVEIAFPKVFGGERSWGGQAGIQVLYLGITVGLAGVGGAVSGVLVKFLNPVVGEGFDDCDYWEVEEEHFIKGLRN